MKKFFSYLIPFLLMAVMVSNGRADNGCSVMALTSLGVGTGSLTITNPVTHSPETVYAGTVNATVDGNPAGVYCIDLNHGVSVPSSNFNDSGFADPPVAWILTHYYPAISYPYAGSLSTVNKEAAAIQLAIWYFTDNLDYTTLVGNTDIKNRAKEIIDAAINNAGTFQPPVPLQIVPVSVLNNCSIKDTLKARVVDANGNGVSGKVLTVTVTGGTVNSSSVTTGAGGYSTPIIVTKSGPNTTVTISGTVAQPIGIRFCNIGAPLTTQHMGLGTIVMACSHQAIDLHCDTTSSGGSGGVETNYNMAEALLKRHVLIESGQTTPIIANTDFIFPPTYSLSQLAPVTGPFNTTRFETTPFDILGISNATSAYAADYKYGNTRLGAIFSTTTNAPEVYSHSKPACDRLARMVMNHIEVKYIDGHQFYLAELYNPIKHYTDYTVIFSVYESSTGFKVDNKWTIQEYSVPSGTIGVYNYQIWAGSPEGAVEMTKSVLAKFAGYKPVTYPTTNLNQPNIFIKSSSYTNDGKMNFTVKNNFSSAQTMQFTFQITPQQGMAAQTVNQNITVQPGESNITVNLGYLSSASVTMSQPGEFKDAVFVGGGVYGSYNGPLSTVETFQNIVTSSNPSLPQNSLVFPGGVRMKGHLGDKVYIMRSLDGAYSGINLSNFSKLRFEASGTGTMSVYIEATVNGTVYHPFVNVPLTSTMTTREIPLTSFLLNGQPINMSNVTMVSYQIDKGINPSMTSYDFTVQNAGIVANSVGIGSNGTEITSYALAQNYPNPFNPVTKINFALPKQGHVTLSIYDVMGKLVQTLISENRNAGEYSVNFDGGKLSSGVYYYKLETAEFTETKKMLLVK